ncbi:MAG: hypothetical protein GWN00_13920, partial [Aliifodinibius sp.]|nr:SOS response-associated peptidase [candidate division KSB1 bacterium]NIT57282.1 SOS response-associated peptidase [Fodinibius sp.]NIV12222.1 hypothetical protein [Fodinibius sp.]NIY25864.1 hypothetical protein [Fodinibius sp.]
IPANSFYEWQKVNGRKVPYNFELKDQHLMTFGGIYSIWRDRQGNEKLSCSIITVPPNSIVKPIHNRMPFVLTKEHERAWLDRNITDPEYLKELIKPYPDDNMRCYQVSQTVNNAKNDDPWL